MHCPHCGKATSVSDDRCVSCGGPLGAAGDGETKLSTPDVFTPQSDEATRLSGDSLTPDPAAVDDEVARLSDEVDPLGDSATRLSDDEATRLSGVEAGSERQPHAAAGPLEVGEPFGMRYRIERLLGAGGMGAVYQAFDRELGIPVALKVIRPEISRDPEKAKQLEQRFKRELLLARQVTHKNVVRIHDIGELDGIKYITMSYVDGADLQTILNDLGTLPVPRALQIARHVVDGLVAAHEAGVVHRDLKPANIMISAEDEDALIMDFGVARFTSKTTTMTASGVTEHKRKKTSLSTVAFGQTSPGAVVGTAQYMAPEQAKGLRADQRADVYAFGLIFREMFIKRSSDQVSNPIAELMNRAEGAPEPVGSVVENFPEALDRVITRCLQPDRDVRYQTSAELAADLAKLDENGHALPVLRTLSPSLMAGAAVLMVTLLAGTWWLVRTSPVPVQPDPMSVLIANFQNLTGDPVFEGALEETLGIAIEGASFVTTVNRTTAERIGQTLQPGGDLDEAVSILIASQEKIDLVLAGSIETDGSEYEVSIRAINPSEQEPIFDVSESAPSRDAVLQTVAALATEIRNELGDVTPDDVQQAELEPFATSAIEVVQSYSRAQSLQAIGNYEEAYRYYELAAEQDPDFGRAQSGLATAAFFLGRQDVAEESWTKALSLVDRMTERERYRTLGTYYLAVARNYEAAIENYATLVQLYPADRVGRNNLAYAYFATLNFPQALEQGRAALDLYPRNPIIRTNYALYAMYASDFETAAQESLRVIEQEPTFHKGHLGLAIAGIMNTDFDAARDAYAQMANVGAQGASLASIGLADLAIYEGKLDEAREILEAGITEDEATNDTAGQVAKQIALAEIYEALHDNDAAIEMVQSALAVAQHEAVAVPAARLLARVGREDDARAIAGELNRSLQTQPRAYGKVIEGLLVASSSPADALDAFRAGVELADVWLARYAMGVTYVEAGAYAEALAQLEACFERRGEATAMFLDDVPSVRYLAALPYWLGRAQEGLGMSESATESYKSFLAVRGDNAADDPLVEDARERLE